MARIAPESAGNKRGSVTLSRAADVDPPPSVDGRRARHAHRRPELLSAATDYVFEHGLAGLTIRPLAKELGITHRGLLHHFGSKEQLVSEILHELRGRDRQRIAEAGGRLTATGEDPIMIAWKRMSGEPYFNYWRAYFEVFGIALRDEARYGHFLDGFVAEWLELLSPLLIDAGCPPGREAAPISPRPSGSWSTPGCATCRGTAWDFCEMSRRRFDRGLPRALLAPFPSLLPSPLPSPLAGATR